MLTDCGEENPANAYGFYEGFYVVHSRMLSDDLGCITYPSRRSSPLLVALSDQSRVGFSPSGPAPWGRGLRPIDRIGVTLGT